VYDIMRQAFLEYAGALPQESGALRESVDDVRAAMQEGGAVLAFVGDAAVGSARFLPEDEALYVGRVAVVPACRRRGIASALMRYLEDLARDQGLEAVRIGVRESLPSNIALYEKLGYVEVKREPHGADRSLTMLKRVSAP
jgi:ribosomal protein S18 acetylase RimI-like enzyme